MSALQAYEAQASSLMRATSRLEEELRSARAEKASVLADLASVRELCVKLDSSKELTTRQLTAKSMELERVSFAQCIHILSIHIYVRLIANHPTSSYKQELSEEVTKCCPCCVHSGDW